MFSKRLILLVALFLPGIFRAQFSVIPEPAYNITLDLMNVSPEKDRVRVTVITPPIQGKSIKYILPKYLPGVPTPVNAGRFVHQFYALDSEGFPLKVKKKDANTILIKLRKGTTLRKIEYWIDDSWDVEKLRPKMPDEKFNYVPQPAGSNIEAGSNFVLNHAFFFGYLAGYSNIPYNITVLRPTDMWANGALNVMNESRGKDTYHASNYYELIDNPMIYCVADTIGFQSGNVYVRIAVFSENGKISARLVRKLIATQVIAATKFIADNKPQKYHMLFYFTTSMRTVLNKHGGYGGLAHTHSSFYFLPELSNEDALASEIQRVSSGDILQLLCPPENGFSAYNGNLLTPQIGKNWWFCEGVNRYLGSLALVHDSLISENEFMGTISAKIKLMQFLPAEALTSLPMIQHMMKKPLTRESVRARAMLTAFLLDIRMNELTGGRIGLREAIIALNREGKFPADSLEKKLVARTDPALASFFTDYVNGKKPLPFIEYFGKIGWAYAPATLDSVLTFGQFGLLYDDGLDAFYVNKPDSANRFELRQGDRIISVNSTIIGAANFEQVLNAIYYPRKNVPVELVYIRNTQNFRVTGYPVVKEILIEHMIRRDNAASDVAVLLHKRVFNSP
ncbi:MAG TPA: hypothetical protein VI731_01465 [Bacteroidia bacterium]|nr:hypothetical protein [Bacteroidia bacterium]